MTVNVVKAVNRRVGLPSVNAPVNGGLDAGTLLEVADIVHGDVIDGNGLWYKDASGSYYWSGAFSANLPVVNINALPWWLASDKMRIPEIWKYTSGKDIRVAVLDTGVSRHDDLVDAVDWESGYNAITQLQGDVQDTDGHGTHCAGIIAARGKRLVTGIAPSCIIIPIKVYETSTSPISVDSLLRGIEYASRAGADILSMSFGIYNEPAGLESAIEQVVNDDTRPELVIAAVGNTPGTVLYPAKYPSVIGIGAARIDSNGGFVRRDTSGGGESGVAILAPGENIISCSRDNGVFEDQGTSMAAAYVAGVCALLYSFARTNSSMTFVRNRQDVLARLTRNPFPSSQPCSVLDCGSGIINPYDAVLNWT